MAIECTIDINRYLEHRNDRARVRVLPIDKFGAWTNELPAIAALSTEHHFLRVPLLGQQVLFQDLGIDEANDFCGRTSASMLYNYFQLLQGGDPKDRYVSHSRGGGGASWPFDLRFGTNHLAFCLGAENGIEGFRKGTADPEGAPGTSYSGPIPVALANAYPLSTRPEELNRRGVLGLLRYDPPRYMLPMESSQEEAMEARLRLAEEIAGDEGKLAERLSPVLDSLRKNNPILFRGAVTNGTIHFFVLSGYCYLRDQDKPDPPHLWFVISDPATKNNQVYNTDLGFELLPKDLKSWKGPKSTSNAVMLETGDFNAGRASLYLLRASLLFRAKLKPPHVVKHGLWMDYWSGQTDRAGGRYLARSTPTLAPREALLSSRMGAKFPCPLDGTSDTVSLWQHYLNTEKSENGAGGFYVLGLKRNLHGGIHLFPESKGQAKVRALAPGFVVAARLPALASAPMQGPAKQHLANWPGFVLVQHEVVERKAKPKEGEEERRGVFFSLYMHLASPRSLLKPEQAHAQLRADEPYCLQVPWFRSLWERRFGAFVKVQEDPPPAKDAPAPADHLPLGSVVWAAEEVEVDGTGVPTRASYSVTDSSVRSIEVKAKDGALRWLFKPSPATLLAAADGLADGKVVTFAEPFLPVQAGEVLGLVEPMQEVKKRSLATMELVAGGATEQRQVTLPSGFLHWQVFAPVDGIGETPSGIPLIVEQLEKIHDVEADPLLPKIEPPKIAEVADDGDDNFLDLAELRGKLAPALPKEDGEQFAAAFEELDEESRTEFGYAAEVIRLLDSKTSFAPKPEKQIWEAGCKYGYPVILQLEPEHLPSPDKHVQAKGKYTFTLRFEKLVDGKPVNLVCGRECNQAECGKPGCSDQDPAPHPGDCRPPPLVIDTDAFSNAKNEKGTALSFVLRVPAEADQVVVTPGEGLVCGAGAEPAGGDVLLLSKAMKERWRGVKLRQLSEWSVKGFDALVKKLEKDLPIPAEAKELAWLDSAKELPIARQKLSIAEGGLKASPEEWKGLFDPADGALKADAKIDNLHPVTAAWALNLLDKYRRVIVRDDWPAQSFRAEDPAPLCARWLSSEAGMRVGDTVRALVLDEDFGYDRANRVELFIENGSTKLALGPRSYGPGGLIVEPVDVCFWGDGWKLTTEPAEKGGPELLGKKVLDVPALEFAELTEGDVGSAWNQPHAAAKGVLRWSVKVKGTLPRSLEGVVSLQVRKAGEDWRSGGEPILLPAHASLTDGPDEAKDAPLNRGMLRIEDGFVVGVDETKVPKGKSPGSVEVSKGLTWEAYRSASTDVRIACSLVDGLQAIRATLTADEMLKVTHVAADGLSLRVQPLSRAKLGAPKLLKCAEGVAGKVGGLTVEGIPAADDKTVREVLLSVNAGLLQGADQCRHLKAGLGDLQLDPTGQFILGSTGSQLTKNFTLRHLATAWEGDGQVRASEVLVKVLHAIFTKVKGLKLAFLSDDGYTCWLDGPDKALRAAENFAKADWRVSCADRGDALKMVVLADPGQMLPLQVDPAPVLSPLMAGSDLEAGADYEYRLLFETLNGIHLLAGPGGCPCHGGTVDKATFEALAEKSSERLTYGPSGVAGRFRKMGFGKELAFEWVNRSGRQYIEIAVELKGGPKSWAGYSVGLHMCPSGGAFAPVKGQERRISKETSCTFAVLVNPNEPWFQAQGQIQKFKVVAVPPKGATLTPEPVEGEFDCTPRWLGEALELEPSSDGKTLALQCRTAGVEVPAFTNKQGTVPGAAMAFEVVITDCQGNSRPTGILYKQSRKGGGGYLDAAGSFRATLLRRHLPPDAGPYDIRVQTVGEKPVRKVALGARTTSYTPPDEHETEGSPL